MRDPNELKPRDEFWAESRPQPPEPKWWVGVTIALLVAGVAGVIFYFWFQGQLSPPPAPPPVAEAPEIPTPVPEPAIRYPIQRVEPEKAKPLPPLAESDADVLDALGRLIDREALRRFIYPDSIIRRIVVTVDNLPREAIPQRYVLMQPVERSFRVDGREGNLALGPDNAQRYTTYVRLFETADTKALVSAYVYFYPLLQEEYKNIGSPKKYFNDRMVEAIDDLLAAPAPEGAIKLVQPKVFYKFADPKLEALSAGQKIMIRMGNENAARVKTKLRELRSELVNVR
jgi:hypothetical protein